MIILFVTFPIAVISILIALILYPLCFSGELNLGKFYIYNFIQQITIQTTN